MSSQKSSHFIRSHYESSNANICRKKLIFIKKELVNCTTVKKMRSLCFSPSKKARIKM